MIVISDDVDEKGLRRFEELAFRGGSQGVFKRVILFLHRLTKIHHSDLHIRTTHGISFV